MNLFKISPITDFLTLSVLRNCWEMDFQNMVFENEKDMKKKFLPSKISMNSAEILMARVKSISELLRSSLKKADSVQILKDFVFYIASSAYLIKLRSEPAGDVSELKRLILKYPEASQEFKMKNLDDFLYLLQQSGCSLEYVQNLVVIIDNYEESYETSTKHNIPHYLHVLADNIKINFNEGDNLNQNAQKMSNKMNQFLADLKEHKVSAQKLKSYRTAEFLEKLRSSECSSSKILTAIKTFDTFQGEKVVFPTSMSFQKLYKIMEKTRSLNVFGFDSEFMPDEIFTECTS